jgi:hypothetical protein
MDANQTSEFLKTLLENMNSNYTILFTVLIAMTTVLVGSSWLWNIFIAKKQIQAGINAGLETLKKQNIENEKTLRESLKTDLIKEIDDKYSDQQIDICRLFAIYSDDNEFYELSVFWWSNCLEHSIKSNFERTISISVTSMLDILKKPEFVDYSEDNFKMEKVINVVNSVPEILHNEKKEILRFLRKLKQKE